MPINNRKSMPAYLDVYTGENEMFQERIYVDLVVGSRDVTILDSEETIDFCSPTEFAKILEKTLREVSIYKKALNIPVVIDKEDIMESMGGDECTPAEKSEVLRIIREFKD